MSPADEGDEVVGITPSGAVVTTKSVGVSIGRIAQGTPAAKFIQIQAPEANAVTDTYSFPWMLDAAVDEKTVDAAATMLDSIAAAAGFIPLRIEDILVEWRRVRPLKEAP